MTITITLTSAGSDSGPFDIYGNSTGSFVLITSGVSKLSLTSGYNISVPDGTTVVRVQSTGTCTNYQDIPVQTTTTTVAPTTTIAPVNGTINIYCNTVYNEGEPLSATVEVSALTGGSGTYQITNTLYLSEAGALGGTYVNAGSSPVNYSLVENNTWWVGIRDTNNPTNKIAKQIVVNCQAACTEYTVSTTSGSGQSYSYTACDGTASGGAIGGSGGYDADTFCAQTGTVTLLGSELTLTANLACTVEPTTTVAPTTQPPGELCFYYDAVVAVNDLQNSQDGNVYFVYTDCNGVQQTNIQSNEGTWTNAFCATGFVGTYFINTNNQQVTGLSTADYTGQACGNV